MLEISPCQSPNLERMLSFRKLKPTSTRTIRVNAFAVLSEHIEDFSASQSVDAASSGGHAASSGGHAESEASVDNSFCRNEFRFTCWSQDLSMSPDPQFA